MILKCIIHINKETKSNSEYENSYGCLSYASNLRSFITDWTDRLSIIRTLDISFSAKSCLVFLICTRHTYKPIRIWIYNYLPETTSANHVLKWETIMVNML